MFNCTEHAVSWAIIKNIRNNNERQRDGAKIMALCYGLSRFPCISYYFGTKWKTNKCDWKKKDVNLERISVVWRTNLQCPNKKPRKTMDLKGRTSILLSISGGCITEWVINVIENRFVSWSFLSIFNEYVYGLLFFVTHVVAHRMLSVSLGVQLLVHFIFFTCCYYISRKLMWNSFKLLPLHAVSMDGERIVRRERY